MSLIHLRWIFMLTVASISITDATNTERGLLYKKIILETQIDDLFDNILPAIKQVLINSGMDPLNVTGFSEEVPLPGLIKGSIDLKNGWVYHLPNLRRAGSVIMSYSDKQLTIKSTLGWRVVDFDYDYVFRYLLMKREGTVNGRFVNLKADVVIVFDVTKRQVILQSIKFNQVSIFYLSFGGHLSDKLINPISRVVTTVGKVKVLKNVEARSLYVFRKVFEDLNTRIKRQEFQGERTQLFSSILDKADNNTLDVLQNVIRDISNSRK